jgi:hypothetical protein
MPDPCVSAMQQVCCKLKAGCCVLGVCAMAVLAGCASPSVNALHDPLYRASAHTSTITANATDTRNGVSQIRIDVVEGDITPCSPSPFTLPSLAPCRANATAVSRTCFFANVKVPVSCSFPRALGDRRLITYTATARNGSGSTSSTPAITYAAGAPITQAQIGPPLPPITLSWETARPVLWHTDAPAGNSTPADKLDVGFFPDADFGTNYQAFTDGMQPIALGAFFNSTDQFANLYTVFKGVFNLWAGPAGADAEGCSRTFAGSAATIAGVTDGDAILHQNAFRDCASIALGGAGSTQTTLGDAAWVFTHESGHYLHGLGDEYVGGGNSSVSDPNNIYSSQSTCQSAATTLSISTSSCAQIGTTGKWRMDDGNATTMEDRVLTSDWRTASGIAVNRRIGKCLGGSCY